MGIAPRTGQSTTFSATDYFYDHELSGGAQLSQQLVNSHSQPVVSYYFPKGVGEYHYGERHPMKPHRLTLTNSLVIGYGLDKKINHFFSPRAATRHELEAYHDEDYINFLSRVAPDNQATMKGAIDMFNCVEDCPIFSDMYEFFRQYAGASLAGARKLCQGTTDIAINWSGGLHHAKRGEASGFCYINDIVLAILELLRYHPRVLYIDIDIHHGDGVELAFWNSNRVMTVSFHKYNGDFFPGTGKLDDNGGGLGKHFCLNIPLQDGIDDKSYTTVFRTVIESTVTSFNPSSIVLQCGADSLGCDRLGAFNLSIKAHGECVEFVKDFNLPLLILGGGGYTIHNVSRCWTYETAVLLGASVPDTLPTTPYDEYFAPDYNLHPKIVQKVENLNSDSSLHKIIVSTKNKLRYLQGAPSVAMQEIPPDLAGWLDDEERNAEEKDEERSTGQAGERRHTDRHMARNEYFDGEKDIEKDDEPVSRATGPKRGRGRGRGRARANVVVDRTPDDGDDSPPSTPAPPKRARGGRGRGRGRGRGKAKEVDSTPDGDD